MSVVFIAYKIKTSKEGGVEVAPVLGEDSAMPTLLAGQARALVQSSEERFTSLQGQATTLLAVVGVVASVGGAFVAGFIDRNYEWSTHVLGHRFSLALLAAVLTGLLGVRELFRSGVAAIAVMRLKPDPAPEKLTPVLSQQFPDMLEQAPSKAVRTLLELAAGQHQRLQAATTKANIGLKKVAGRLAVAVLSGFALALILLLGTTQKAQNAYLIHGGSKSATTIRATR